MTKVIKNSFILFALLLALSGTAHLVLASEVTGSLSSDGSNDTEQEVGNETTVSAVAQNGQQLQGSVIQGRDVDTPDTSSWTTAMWVVPLTGVALVGFTFYLWRRRMS